MPPKLTILMTAFNEEKYISKAIESALDQTFKDFKFIIINDSSNDATAEIIEKYASIDKRIQIIHNHENIGRQKSLNLGLNKSDGEYIACIDGDDIWCDKNKIKKQLDFLEKNEEYGIIGTAIITIDENGSKLGTIKYKQTDAEIRKYILCSSQFAHPSVMIRKKALGDVGNYSEEKKHKHVEDYEMILRIGTKYKMANLDSYCLAYRINPKGVSLKHQSKQKFRGIALSFRYRKFYPNGLKSILIKTISLIIPRFILDSAIKKSSLLELLYLKLSGSKKTII